MSFGIFGVLVLIVFDSFAAPVDYIEVRRKGIRSAGGSRELEGHERFEFGLREDQNQMFGELFESLIKTLRSTIGTCSEGNIANLGNSVSEGFGIRTDDGGLGGTLGGSLNLLSVGTDILTGVTSHILGRGDLFSGVIPNVG